jgi:hypothetical protein
MTPNTSGSGTRALNEPCLEERTLRFAVVEVGAASTLEPHLGIDLVSVILYAPIATSRPCSKSSVHQGAQTNSSNSRKGSAKICNLVLCPLEGVMQFRKEQSFVTVTCSPSICTSTETFNHP